MTAAALREALERGELKVYYQPRFSLLTGEIVGTEALLRWESPERGMVLPMSFIPMAEESGLMAQIEDRVMQEAFDQTRIWRTTHADLASLTISVNLSADRFQHPELVERVASLLHGSRIAATGVQLEITHYKRLQMSRATGDTLRASRTWA